MSASNGHALRRSSRVPINVPIRVTSLEPDTQFSEMCETLVVNAHGCALRVPMKLDAGRALRLHNRGGRQATAYVVVCQPMGSDEQSWRLGARFDRPQNFWGLEACPEDWQVLEMPSPGQPRQKISSNDSLVVRKFPDPSKASQAFIDKIEEQLSEERLRGILGRLVRPLQSDVAELQEKLARSARQNRFEVSLGHIPPELEEKLWERLRQEVGERVLKQAREQSAEVFEAAKATIEQKTGEALNEFRNRLSGELHAVQRRAQALSKELTTATQQQVQAGVEKMQHTALDAAAELNARSEKLLEKLQRRLVETHDVHCREIEKIQADASSQASRLQAEATDLKQRIEVLNESVRRLEADLDAHLASLAEEIVTEARAHLDSATGAALKELQLRGTREVEARVDEACGHLRTIQNRIEHSFSGSLENQGEQAAHFVEQQFEELAQQAVEKWRHGLARDLNSVAKTLGQQLRKEMEDEIN